MKDSLKNKLKQHRPEWDKEAFWAELEPELPKKPRRRRFAWWMWILPAGLITFSSAAWYSYAQNLQHSYKPSIPITSFAIPASGDVLPPISIPSKGQLQAVAVEEPTNDSIYQRITDYNTGQNAFDIFSPTPLTPSESSSEQALEMEEPGRRSAKGSSKAFKIPGSIVSDRTTNEQKSYQKAEVLKPVPATLQNAGSTQIIESALSETPALPPKEANEGERHSNDIIVSTDQLPQLPFQALAGKKPKLPLISSPEPTTEKAAGQWYQFYALGIAQPTRHYRNTPPEIQDKKKQEEGLREVATAGYLIGYRHRSGLYAQAGLELQQRRELLQWQGLVDSSLVDQNIARAYFIYDPNGQPAYQEGELEVTQLTRRIITQQNYYRMINLPVQLGYEYRYQRWSGFAQAGLHLNLLHTFSGKFIDADNQVQEAATVNKNILSRNLGLGWSAGIGFSYRLLPEIDLFLRTDYQQLDTSIHRGQGYEQWYSNWGIKIGVRKRL